MAEKPILFKGEMVRAILAGRKTMTRRVTGLEEINEAPDLWNLVGDNSRGWHFARKDTAWECFENRYIKCPYGVAGDRLWVREPWAVVNFDGVLSLAYKADGATRDDELLSDGKRGDRYIHGPWYYDLIGGFEGTWKSLRYMPRWASRITLEVTAVKAERLQSITHIDAYAEGVCHLRPEYAMSIGNPFAVDNARYALTRFQEVWDSINAKPKPVYADKKIVAYECYPWSDESFDALCPGARERGTWRGKPLRVVSNPWVFAYTFGRIDV